MLGVVVDGVLPDGPAAGVVEWVASVWVDVEPREVEARDVMTSSGKARCYMSLAVPYFGCGMTERSS